jgi:5-methylcytosine-specific restriction enzyme A
MPMAALTKLSGGPVSSNQRRPYLPVVPPPWLIEKSERKTAVLLWNPKYYPLEKLQAEWLQPSLAGEAPSASWTCHCRDHLKAGDAIILVQVGNGERGIIASGVCLGPRPRKEGTPRVGVQFTQMVPIESIKGPHAFRKEDMNSPLAERWNGAHFRESGRLLESEMASDLMKQWNEWWALLGQSSQTGHDGLTAFEGEAKVGVSIRFERSEALRNAKLRGSDFCCEVCGFNFERVYGELGRGFIECHHEHPLAARDGASRQTTLDQLRLVCRNCHSMLHKGQPPESPRTIDGLKKLLRDYRGV